MRRQGCAGLGSGAGSPMRDEIGFWRTEGTWEQAVGLRRGMLRQVQGGWEAPGCRGREHAGTRLPPRQWEPGDGGGGQEQSETSRSCACTPAGSEKPAGGWAVRLVMEWAYNVTRLVEEAGWR